MSKNQPKKIKPHKIKAGLLILLWLPLLGLLLVACGGEPSPTIALNAGATPVSGLAATPLLQLADCEKQAISNASTTTPQAVSSANPGGQKIAVPAGFKLFLSSTFPNALYALAYPTGWDLQANQSRNDVKGDFFVANNQGDKRVFVTITGRKLPDGVTDLAGFFKTLQKDFAEQSVNYQREADRKVGGADAYVISFNTDQPGFQAQTIQVIFVAENQAWNASYNTSYGQPLSYCADFARMLDSFTFTSGSK